MDPYTSAPWGLFYWTVVATCALVTTVVGWYVEFPHWSDYLACQGYLMAISGFISIILDEDI
ncbi:MAG: hypothetical protein MN733_21565 [Nitrososphaera sp.]|nr:hypothetical protein [Nitrososphaera sp.]